jgi:hypothetical protein
VDDAPEHPGLLLLRGFAYLLVPDQDSQIAFDDIRRGLQNLKRALPEQETRQEAIALQVMEQFCHYFQRIQDFEILYPQVAEHVLSEFPGRAMARSLHEILPQQAEGLLLSLTLNRIKSLNMQLSRSQ